ncbi:uncharacterized protein LOC143573527 [Bidens hawaiensis]|uniref:uncharacterized protein LOC143573527 n=1 Tax=Bidens hawaiensis TaxID=980011 RepID=UPI00404A7AB9
MMTRQQRHQDQQSKAFYELSALILNLIRYPPPSGEVSTQRITPAGLASMLLGVSLALMFCGSITFLIGFLLMPWVIGLVMLLYVAGIVSSLSILGRAIFCHTLAPASPRKTVPAWKLL